MSTHKREKKYSGVGFLANSAQRAQTIAVDVVVPPFNSFRRDTNNSSPIFQSEGDINEEQVLNKYNYISEQTRKKLVEKTRKDVPNTVVIKQLCDQISFDGNVLEERSLSHTIPFSRYDFQKMYNESFRAKKKKSYRLSPNPRKILLNQNSSDTQNSANSIKKRISTSFLLFGANLHFERLKRPIIERKSNIQIKSLSKNESNKTPTDIWEDHVLSKLSKTTVDLISKDMQPGQWENYKTGSFSMDATETHDKSSNMNNDMSVSGGTSAGLRNRKEMAQIESKVKEDLVDSSVTYFENIPLNNKDVISEKHVQVSYPHPPSKWLVEKESSKMGRITRGMQKWTGFPTLIKEENLILQQISDTSLCDKPARLPNVTKKDYFDDLVSVINEWRNKWILDKNDDLQTLKELKSGMKDVNEQVRFIAVSAVGFMLVELEDIKPVEVEMILNEVIKLLDDDNSLVALAAALSLFSLKKASAKAKDILIKTICEGHSSERWIAIQCLAKYQYHDNCIIKELISNINGKDEQKKEKSIEMLKELSHLSLSVPYMVAEKLNSCSWQDRVIACQVLPILHGTLSDDIAGKLLHLLWNDWSHNVHKAVLQALGKTSNAKLLHRALCKRLQSKNADKKLSAIKVIVYLGVMTTHLLTPFLLCLVSSNDEVCLQSIKLCMKMKLNDEGVLIGLIKLLNSERASKVRIYVLRALGCIGEKSSLIRDNLLWTLRYDRESKLRKEACSALIKLGLCDEEIINALQEMVFIDEDPLVRQEVVLALYSMGVEAVGNIKLMRTIQESIKKLCGKENVIECILESGKETESVIKSLSNETMFHSCNISESDESL